MATLDFIIKNLSSTRFTSPYGRRVHPITGARGSFHRGIDLAAPTGTAIYAPADGRIIHNKTNSGGPSQGYGHYLCIHHPSLGIYTFYAHLRSRSTIGEGRTVKKGQKVAEVGNTGSSTGPHLHFEVHIGQHRFPSQVSVGSSNDPTTDPVERYYPNLAKFRGKSNLVGFKVDLHKNSENKAMWVGEVVADKLNVRTRPTTSGNSPVGSLKKGEKVVVYSETGDAPFKWLYIGDNKYVSNARAEYVKPINKVLYEATVNVDNLNVRAVPNTKFDVLRQLSSGAKVKVYAELNGWAYIGKGEFLSAKYIDKIVQQKEVETPNTKPLWVGEVVANALNVRSKPTTSGTSPINTLKKGERIVVYQETGTSPFYWLQIGKDKYVSNARKEYVKPVRRVLYDGKVTASVLNVRPAPNTKLSPTRQLRSGSNVRVYAEIHGWLYIGNGEFVSADFVKKA